MVHLYRAQTVMGNATKSLARHHRNSDLHAATTSNISGSRQMPFLYHVHQKGDITVRGSEVQHSRSTAYLSCNRLVMMAQSGL